MKRTIKLAVVAALALGTTSAFATNGDVMIGQGAKSRSMGGVGIAKAFGAESALANPANINSTKDMEATLAVTVFMPSVSFKSDGLLYAPGNTGTIDYADSASNLSVIPEIYYSARITDRLVMGFAVAGTAGMGVDYSDTSFNYGTTGTDAGNGSFQMKTSLSLLKVAVPVSYQIDGFTIGAAAVMQYGTLELSHQYQTGNLPPAAFALLDNGIASDTGYGLEVGATYDFSNIGVKGLTLGAVYKSKIGMTYENTISDSVDVFGGATATGIASGDNLAQPEERGVGISYVIGGNTITADYKTIFWGDAAGYSDFGWENQDVFALGYEYAAKSWAFRAGYNYAKSPIAEQDGSMGTSAPGGTNPNYSGAVKNFFNLDGFPGVVETHYTVGGGYNISDAFALDAAFIYVPEVTNSFDISAMAGPNATADVKHSQMGLTLAGTYKF